MNIRVFLLTLFMPLPSVAASTAFGEAVIGNDLRHARQLFQATTSRKRQDCDPVGDGRWICASYNNPSLQDFITGAPGRFSGQPVAVLGDTLKIAKQQFSTATILARVDCDPFGRGWICASFNNPTIHDVGNSADANRLISSNQNLSGQPIRAGLPLPDATVSTPTINGPLLPAEQTPITRNPGTLPNDALYQPGDLLSLNYDSCPDPDDLHAAVAARMVLDHYAFDNGTEYIVTNGTCGDLRPRSDYIENSYRVFDELYDINWNDAFRDEAYSISQVGDHYIRRLEAGKKVWVLDGGPMDFTARVIAYIRGVGTSADLKNISIIQHSHGWNEQHTDPANLRYLEEHVRYIKIDNGNHRGNRTPQLNQSNQQAAFPNVDPALVERFVSDTRYREAWQLAFSMLSTEHRLDGSDTVELLWALGLDSTDIEDWYDFANLFIPASQPASTSTPAELPVTNNADSVTDPAGQPSSDEPASAAAIVLEAESAILGSGWVRESKRSDFSGTGYIRWSDGNHYQSGGQGTTQYLVAPEFTGVYTLRVRARAINPPAFDLNNDVWIRMNGEQAPGSTVLTDWVKVFTTGLDTWQLGGTVDKAHSMEPFKQYLRAGRFYTLEISGRSTDYAIDYLALSPSID